MKGWSLFLDPRFLLTTFFAALKIFWTQYSLRSKTYLDSKKCLTENIFCIQTLFELNNCLDPKLVRTQNCLNPTICLTHNYFKPKLFWSWYFLTKNVIGPKKFWIHIFEELKESSSVALLSPACSHIVPNLNLCFLCPCVHVNSDNLAPRKCSKCARYCRY